MKTTVRYLSALTSLRFVAAAMIVVHHTHGYFGYGAKIAGSVPLDQGVSFFFVLSGFILFYTNRGIASLGDAGRFILARIARIWPLHVATLALTLLFLPQPWGPAGPTLGPALANFFLVHGWVPWPGYFFSYNAVSWSLSTELFFYLCFPGLVLNWQRTWPWKLALCAGSAAAMIGIASATHLSFYDGSAKVSIDSLVYINPLARIFEFALGMLAGHFWVQGRVWFDRLSVPLATALEVAALGLLCVAVIELREVFGRAFAQGSLDLALLRWLVTSSTGPFFAILTMAFASGRGLLGKGLAWRPLVVLGEISFALYMCHQILFRSLTVTGSLAAFGGMGGQYVAYWAMSLGLSYALFRLVEWPCRRGIMGLLPARRREPVPLGVFAPGP